VISTVMKPMKYRNGRKSTTRSSVPDHDRGRRRRLAGAGRDDPQSEQRLAERRPVADSLSA